MSKKTVSFIIGAALVVISFQYMLAPGPVQALDYSIDSSLGNAAASFYGEAIDDRVSRVLANAGDVNGDGFDDILISSPRNNQGGSLAGQVYLVFGRASGWQMDVNVSSANASFLAENANDAADNTGHGLCGADVNGDGLHDIIIGMQQNDDAGTDRGQVYIIFGKKTGWQMDLDLSQANASFRGEANGDWLGRFVGCGGDLNGDGIEDFAVSSSQNDENGADSGQIYVVFGKKSGWTMDASISTANASYMGEAGGDGAGISLRIVPDVNGDMLDDILIGAPNNDRGGNIAGAAFLVFGKKSGWSMDNDLNTKSNASWYGEAPIDALGFFLSGLGDVNGDNYGDIIVSAYNNAGNGVTSGQSYIIFGRKAGWANHVNISAGANASFVGEAAGDLSGRSVAGAGDVNGDGLNDILIGAPGNSEAAASAGEAHLILGKTSGWAMDVNLNQANASWRGERANAIAGRYVDGWGDYNGDGLDDIIVSTHLDSEHGFQTGQAYVVFPDSNMIPTAISGVHAYESTFTDQVKTSVVNATIYVQLNGTDQDAARKNFALVNITSNVSDPFGFRLPLLETGVNTGIFRGNFTVKDRTLETLRWLKGGVGEFVKISSVSDPSKNATVFIGNIDIRPDPPVTTATEDQKYNVKYSTVNGTATKWTLVTNATWLNFNSTTLALEGTPDNSQVGSFRVNLSATNDWGSSDYTNFTLVVKNVPPAIQTTDIISIFEDEQYINDYSSDDDGQGTITWHLTTNATWLNITSATGNLTGLPLNSDVGNYSVNVSVDDGNGGWAFHKFNLSVEDLNDRPQIINLNTLTAYEDSEYKVQYNATDIDLLNDVLTWNLTTNATWLHINETSGLLNGTPSNDDVGRYLVNVTVSDGRAGTDSTSFNLTVINVNDPPTITSVPNVTAWVGQKYIYQALAQDIDKGDVLEFSLVTAPVNMSVNKTAGLVSWTPTLSQNGTNKVVLRVSDGLVFFHQTFNITVMIPSANHLPKATLLAPTDGATIQITNPSLSWKGADQDNDTVVFDIYLGLDQSKVGLRETSMRRASEISMTVYQAPELQKGSTYYWTIIPSDQEGPGDCLSGVWSFTISTTATTNNAPVITSTPVTKAAVGKQYIYDLNATDKDDDALTYSIETGPLTMSIDKRNGLISWVPAPIDVGNVDIWVAVTDGKSVAKQSFVIVVSKQVVIVDNKLPIIDAIAQQTATVDKAFTYTVKATDPDAWDAINLTFNLEKAPTGMTIDPATGVISWTPTKSQLGEHIIIVTVSDKKDSTNNSFVIEVKDSTIPPKPHDDNDPWSGAWLWLLLALIVIVIAIIIAMILVMRRRKAAAEEEAALRAAAPKPRKHKGAMQAAPTKGSYGKRPDTVSVDGPLGATTKVNPGEGTAVSRHVTIGKRSYSKKEIKEVLKALPHELPVFLLLKSVEDAADEILKAEYEKNPDGHVVIKLDGLWYYGDPKYLTKYLTAYEPEPEVEAGAPASEGSAPIVSTTAEAEQRSVADEVMAKLDAKEKAGPPEEDRDARKKGRSAVSEAELEDIHDDKNEKTPEKEKEEELTDIDSLIKDLEMK